jgi:NTP pyrophosphatase (non-canonical NTP hydrolase)
MPENQITIYDFQNLIRKMYFDKDVVRGVSGTWMWLAEEMGELASDLRKVEQLRANIADENQPAEKVSADRASLKAVETNLKTEFADVIAWLTTIANIVHVDLTEAIAAKYGEGCPGCQQLVCRCPDDEKP